MPTPGRVVAVANIHLPSTPYGPYQVRKGWSRADVLRLERDLRLKALATVLRVLPRLAERGIPVFLTGDFNSPSHLDWTPAVAEARDDVPYAVAWPASKALADAGLRRLLPRRPPRPRRGPGLHVVARRTRDPAARLPRPHRLGAARRPGDDGLQPPGRRARQPAGRPGVRPALPDRPPRRGLGVRRPCRRPSPRDRVPRAPPGHRRPGAARRPVPRPGTRTRWSPSSAGRVRRCCRPARPADSPDGVVRLSKAHLRTGPVRRRAGARRPGAQPHRRLAVRPRRRADPAHRPVDVRRR